MRTRELKREALWCSLIVAGLWGLWSVTFAGDLEPMAPPAPTMKTLDEVEPRIPIGPNTTPSELDAVFTINAPGSYYLTRNAHLFQLTISSTALPSTPITSRWI